MQDGGFRSTGKKMSALFAFPNPDSGGLPLTAGLTVDWIELWGNGTSRAFRVLMPKVTRMIPGMLLFCKMS